jgi:hypothetical protein
MIYLGGKYSINGSKTKTQVRSIFSIKQRRIDKITGENYVPFMEKLASFLQCKLYHNLDNSVSIVTQNMAQYLIVKSYFDKYPPMTSKYLNYVSYLESYAYKNKSLTQQEIIQIQFLKNSMNNKRTNFN